MIEETKKLMGGCNINFASDILGMKWMCCGHNGTDYIFCQKCLARIDEAKKRIKEFLVDLNNLYEKTEIATSEDIWVSNQIIKYREELKILQGGKDE